MKLVDVFNQIPNADEDTYISLDGEMVTHGTRTGGYFNEEDTLLPLLEDSTEDSTEVSPCGEGFFTMDPSEVVRILKPMDAEMFNGVDLSAKTGKPYHYQSRFFIDLRAVGKEIEFSISTPNGSLRADFPHGLGESYGPDELLKASRAGKWLLAHGWRITEQSAPDSRCFLARD